MVLSSSSNTYNRGYHAETDKGGQLPMLNVFACQGTAFRHSWASELWFAAGEAGEEARHVDSIWPLWNVLEGRGTDSSFPALRGASPRAACGQARRRG